MCKMFDKVDLDTQKSQKTGCQQQVRQTKVTSLLSSFHDDSNEWSQPIHTPIQPIHTTHIYIYIYIYICIYNYVYVDVYVYENKVLTAALGGGERM